ncbi:MAG TPA: Na/Pi cotransporter family protein, partial [Candidatus Sulfotelmatobacter sp.]|nr:Na/Pi cotransporter family protein [Candidatus Sulfotelmatobacter sp.]
LMLITLFGGMALLLYGMQLVGEGLQQAAGGRMRRILSSLTNSRLKAMTAGAFITAVIQSSSATTIMLVGFAGSGLMSLSQALGVILGADIGTTLTVQLIALQIFDYALLLVGLGFLLIFTSHRKTLRYVGQAIMGFGFIFFAMKVMSDAMAPLRQSDLVKTVLVSLGDQPMMGLLVAAAFSAVVHSSAATIGMAITLSLQGLLPLPAAIPVIFGANIGTCATALASSIGSRAEAKRVALAHIVFKVAGVVLFFPLIHPFVRLVEMTASEVPHQIANAHTLFNVGITVAFLPFARLFGQVIERLVPEGGETNGTFRAKYLDENMLDTPALALGQAHREGLRMADLVSEMLSRTIEAFSRDDPELIERIEETDNQVDTLDRDIKHYLTKLSQQSLTAEQSRREIGILSFINNMENIGDIVDRNLMELAKKRVTKGVHFSEPGMHEITLLHKKVLQNLELAIAAFGSGDPALATQVLEHKLELSQTERRFRQAHIERLHEGYKESIDTSEIHLDVLTNLKRINSHVTAVAYPILEGR